MRKRFITGLLFCIGCIQGCTPLNDHYDCQATPGVRCSSVSQIDKATDAGVFHYTATQPARTTEKIMRIWVAPFEDSQGDYHTDQLIYTVTDHSRWVSTHTAAVEDEG